MFVWTHVLVFVAGASLVFRLCVQPSRPASAFFSFDSCCTTDGFIIGAIVVEIALFSCTISPLRSPTSGYWCDVRSSPHFTFLRLYNVVYDATPTPVPRAKCVKRSFEIMGPCCCAPLFPCTALSGSKVTGTTIDAVRKHVQEQEKATAGTPRR